MKEIGSQLLLHVGDHRLQGLFTDLRPMSHLITHAARLPAHTQSTGLASILRPHSLPEPPPTDTVGHPQCVFDGCPPAAAPHAFHRLALLKASCRVSFLLPLPDRLVQRLNSCLRHFYVLLTVASTDAYGTHDLVIDLPRAGWHPASFTSLAPATHGSGLASVLRLDGLKGIRLRDHFFCPGTILWQTVSTMQGLPENLAGVNLDTLRWLKQLRVSGWIRYEPTPVGGFCASRSSQPD
jgi:hypothetical protein